MSIRCALGALAMMAGAALLFVVASIAVIGGIVAFCYLVGLLPKPVSDCIILAMFAVSVGGMFMAFYDKCRGL